VIGGGDKADDRRPYLSKRAWDCAVLCCATFTDSANNPVTIVVIIEQSLIHVGGSLCGTCVKKC